MCDVEKKTCAYNMDLPHTPEVYAHTSGACGRSMLYAYIFFSTSHMPSQIAMSELLLMDTARYVSRSTRFYRHTVIALQLVMLHDWSCIAT